MLMIAETRLDNACSLVISKSGRTGYFRHERPKDAGVDHGRNVNFVPLSVSQMSFPVNISIKTKYSLIF